MRRERTIDYEFELDAREPGGRWLCLACIDTAVEAGDAVVVAFSAGTLAGRLVAQTPTGIRLREASSGAVLSISPAWIDGIARVVGWRPA